jgi:hypothetical protein
VVSEKGNVAHKEILLNIAGLDHGLLTGPPRAHEEDQGIHGDHKSEVMYYQLHLFKVSLMEWSGVLAEHFIILGPASITG